MNTPTLMELFAAYAESAAIERLKTGKPDTRTIRNTRSGLSRFAEWARTAGYPAPPSLDLVTAPVVRKYLTDLLAREIRPISALSYVNHLRQLFARWALPYYEDLGWRIPPFPAVSGRALPSRYCRPPAERIARVKDWYRDLTSAAETRPATRGTWFAATMMLEFAMRNGDILGLTGENFVEQNGRPYLDYTPHKTRHSSGRRVHWPIHPDIWSRLFPLPEITKGTFDALNKSMRELGFTGTKGAYELRKICIDHVYQRYGAEMATSISGDDIRTIMRYYADPSQPNIGNTRITDLL